MLTSADLCHVAPLTYSEELLTTDDLSGHPTSNTVNIDRLASQGAKLTTLYRFTYNDGDH